MKAVVSRRCFGSRIRAEFMVAGAQVLDEGVSGADHSGRAKLFEAVHRPQPSLESPMTCFDKVIGVLPVIWQAAGTNSSSTRG